MEKGEGEEGDRPFGYIWAYKIECHRGTRAYGHTGIHAWRTGIRGVEVHSGTEALDSGYQALCNGYKAQASTMPRSELHR